jgi:hypothetical protein
MCPHCRSAIVGWLESVRPEYLDQEVPFIMPYRAYTCLECGYKWEEPTVEIDDENTPVSR